MRAYLDLLRNVLDNGVTREDRTGTGTRSLFGYQLRVDLGDGFPLLTTKKVHLKSMLPFQSEPHPGLKKSDTNWYTKNWQKYRQQQRHIVCR